MRKPWVFTGWLTIGLMSACGESTEDTQSLTGSTLTTGSTTPTTVTGTTHTGTEVVTWLEHGVVTCEEPELRTADGPIYEPDLGQEWHKQEPAGVRWPEDKSATAYPGYGITVVDLNEDDIKDILLPFYGENRVFMGNEDGSFSLETSERWLNAGQTRNTESLVAADINGDGYMDVAEMNRNQPNRLFINNGKGVLEYAEAESGDMAQFSYASVGGAWGDMDRDDNLDLIVSNHWIVELDSEPQKYMADPNILYRLGSDGGLSEFTDWPQKKATAYTFVSSWFDLNEDSWPDLYFSNDYGPFAIPNVALINNQGIGFSDKTEEVWLAQAMGAMGIGIGDTNNDSHPDLIISNWGPVIHFESLGDGTWYQKESGIRPLVQTDNNYYCCYPTWGMDVADLDNDGDLDVPLAAGTIMKGHDPKIHTNPSAIPNSLFLWEEERFVNRASEWGFDWTENHRGLVVTDMNDDGYLDFLARDLNGAPRVQYSRCGERNWAKIELAQPGNNHYAIGARIDVTAGDLNLVRWITAGSTSFASTGPPEAHFGLDTQETLSIKVTWPDGTVSVIDGIAANQTISVERMLKK